MKNWDKARAVVLYEYGATDKEIAAEVGVNPITIYRWRAKNGLAAHGLTNPAPVADAVPAPKLPPPEPPEAEAVKDPDGSGPPGTEQDSSGHNGPGADGSGPPGTEQDSSGHNGPGADGSGPMELYLELCGGWVRLRAPDWQTGQRLCDMITELVGRVGAMGWPHE